MAPKVPHDDDGMMNSTAPKFQLNPQLKKNRIPDTTHQNLHVLFLNRIFQLSLVFHTYLIF